MSKFCPNCGKEYDGEPNFCPSCGEKFNQNIEENTLKIDNVKYDNNTASGCLAVLVIILIVGAIKTVIETKNIAVPIVLIVFGIGYFVLKKSYDKNVLDISPDIENIETELSEQNLKTKCLKICKKILFNNILRNIFGYLILILGISALFETDNTSLGFYTTFGVILILMGLVTIPKTTVFIEKAINKTLPNWLKLAPTILLITIWVLSIISTPFLVSKLSISEQPQKAEEQHKIVEHKQKTKHHINSKNKIGSTQHTTTTVNGVYVVNASGIKKIKLFLNPGVKIVKNKAYYTKSSSFHNVSFVGAKIKSHGHIKNCLWVINGDNLSGIVLSANDCAVKNSYPMDARTIREDVRVSENDDGYQRILDKLSK